MEDYNLFSVEEKNMVESGFEPLIKDGKTVGFSARIGDIFIGLQSWLSFFEVHLRCMKSPFMLGNRFCKSTKDIDDFLSDFTEEKIKWSKYFDEKVDCNEFTNRCMDETLQNRE